MDHGLCNVVYLDRRAQEEGVIRRDRLQATHGGSVGKSLGGYFDTNDVQPNINTILSTFNEVFVCSTGASCLRKIEELDQPNTTTPTIILVEIPFEETGRRRPSRDHLSPSPGSKRRSAVEPNEPDDVYGLDLLAHLSSEIQQRMLSKLIMPVAILSDVDAMGSDSAAALPSPSLPGARVLADPVRMARFVDAGAVDVLTSPLSKDRVQGLAVHAYRMFKEWSKDSSSTFALSRRNRKLSWVGINEERPFAYLREAMVSSLMDGICNPESSGEFFNPADLDIPLERKAAVADAIGNWSFSAHHFNSDELLYAALLMLEHALQMPELEQWQMSTDDLITFLMACRRAYNDFVLYHNFRHVIDVLQAVFFFLLQIGILPTYPESEAHNGPDTSPVASILKPFDALTLLVSAIGHDVGHPGVNNAFLVALNAPLAQLYNDRSVLEAFHCAAYSQILRRYWPVAFADIAMRKLMINSILATDMGLHFRYMADMGNLQEKLAHNEKTLDGWSAKIMEETKDLACGLLIKCADISNVARNFAVAAQWAKILTDEFSNQGNMEKELNLPTCLFGGPPDREDVIKLGESQIGFSNIFARPLFEGITDIFPTMGFSIEELAINKSIWEERINAERVKRGWLMSSVAAEKPTPSPFNESSVSLDMQDPREPLKSPSPSLPPLPSLPRDDTPPTPTNISRAVTSAARERSEGDQYYPTQEDPSRRSPRISRRQSSIALPQASNHALHHAASRRSSKDFALDQLEQLQLGQLSTFSRLDNQSFPTSRRGSADASLTTIYVSSQQKPGEQGSPSPTKATSPPKRTFRPASQPQTAGARFSNPSSRSHATSNATATTTIPQSPSTQASTVTDTDGPQPDSIEPPPILSTENPFLRPNISPDLQCRGKLHSSAPDILSVPDVGPEKTNIIARINSGASDKATNPGGPQESSKERPDLRQSRSRSGLRGLRFWRKRWKSPSTEVEESP